MIYLSYGSNIICNAKKNTTNQRKKKKTTPPHLRLFSHRGKKQSANQNQNTTKKHHKLHELRHTWVSSNSLGHRTEPPCHAKRPQSFHDPTALLRCFVTCRSPRCFPGKFEIKVPIPSMYGIYTYIWLILKVNVGKYTIHGWYGVGQNSCKNLLEFVSTFHCGSMG